MEAAIVLARFGPYSAHRVDLPGGRKACVIGPDFTGRQCVMGHYFNAVDACRSARIMGMADGPLIGEFCRIVLD